MKQKQYSYELKRRVLEVSRNLFLEKGYSKTTIREIRQKAGITTGCLYHHFKGKEDILLQLTCEVFNGATTYADAKLGKTGDPCHRFSLTIGIQLYLVRKYDSIAELYLAAHQSAVISQLIVQAAFNRNRKLFENKCRDFSQEDHYAAVLAVKGILYSFIQETLYNQQHTKNKKALIFRAIEMALIIYQIPKAEIKKAIRKTNKLIQDSDLQLYGFTVP